MSKTNSVLISYKTDVILDNIEHLRWRLDALAETPANEVEILKIKNSITRYLELYDYMIAQEKDIVYPYKGTQNE